MSPSPSRICPAAPSRRGFTLIELLVVIAIIAVLAGIAFPVLASVQGKSKNVKCASNLREIGAALNLFVADNDGCLPAAKTFDTGLQWTKQVGPYLPQRGNNPTSQESVIFICPAANYVGYKNANLSRTYTASSVLLYFPTATSGGTSTFPDNTISRRRPANLSNSSSTIMVTEGKLQASATTGACDSATNWTTVSSDIAQSKAASTGTLDFRHSTTINTLYVDGHVGNIPFTSRSTFTKPLWEGR